MIAARVAILVAARNEAPNLPRCLEALLALRWPTDQLEIWVGDDDSEDETATVVRGYARLHPHLHLHQVVGHRGLARGKANVIAQLAECTSADFLLVTDADIAVHPDWVRAMLEACPPSVGIVTGFTLVSGRQPMARLQSLEWLLALGLIKDLADRGIPLTAMGNNMLIRREAYRAVGGYESLPFSVTEDFALFQAVVAQGWGFAHTDQPGAIAHTLPILSLRALLRQRKRWLHGALQSPWYFRLGYYASATTWPAMVGLLAFSPKIALVFWLIRSLPTYANIPRIIRLKQARLLPWLPLVDGYIPAMHLVMLINYYLPGQINWKGRRYDKALVR